MSDSGSVVATISLKGGTGKTSIAVHLAAALFTPRRSVVLVDADPQRSAAQWAESGELPFPVVALDASRGAARFKADLSALDADLTILDCPPELAETAMVAALLADLMLIPCGASALDLRAAKAAVDLAREAREERSGALPLVSLVPSKLISRTRLANELAGVLADFGEPVSPGIYQRVAVAEASVAGGVAPSSSLAGQEFAALAEYVLKRLRRV